MKRGSDEFTKVQEAFEKYIAKYSNIRGNLTREKGNLPSVYYEDGTINEHFKTFLFGYQTGRIEYLHHNGG